MPQHKDGGDGDKYVPTRGIAVEVVRSVPLRVAAFLGAYDEPPHFCGVTPCALFP
ncbi:hypothetical protein BACI349Y_140015 [Bacillus sp. 349Y]|nr:hypothetical protein BACI349Y_140015 [Bacillus sp. 349Y]